MKTESDKEAKGERENENWKRAKKYCECVKQMKSKFFFIHRLKKTEFACVCVCVFYVIGTKCPQNDSKTWKFCKIPVPWEKQLINQMKLYTFF